MSYTLRQTSDLTGLSTKTLRRKIASGELAATKQQGKYGEEYIIEEIPDQLLVKAGTTTGQAATERNAESAQQAAESPQVSPDSQTLESSEGPTSGQPLPSTPDQGGNGADVQAEDQGTAQAIARDRDLFSDLFSFQTTGQKGAKSQPRSTGQSEGQRLPAKEEKKASVDEKDSGGVSAAATGQISGQTVRHTMDSDATLHELLKLIRKLQEENAALHEKIGELNATVQLLSSGRMLPMSIPFLPQSGKSWWQKLTFWKK